MKKKLGVLLVLMVAFAFLGCTQHMSPEQIAKNMIEKYKSIKDLKATEIIDVNSSLFKYNETYEYVFKKPDKVFVLSKNSGNIIVRNGSKLWIYYKKTNTVVVVSNATNVSGMKVDNKYYKETIESMLSKYNMKIVGNGKVAGRDCYILQLTPKNKTKALIKPKVVINMWVDKVYWYPIKIVRSVTFPGMNSTVTIEYTNVSFNTGVNDSLFNFRIPPGAKIVQK